MASAAYGTGTLGVEATSGAAESSSSAGSGGRGGSTGATLAGSGGAGQGGASATGTGGVAVTSGAGPSSAGAGDARAGVTSAEASASAGASSSSMSSSAASTKSYSGAKYAYVVPQVGRYVHASKCGPRFSFVGLDRSLEPPSLVSGEYCNGTDACDAAFAGRLFRWPLDPVTGRLGAMTSYPSEAFYMGEKQVQGALMRQGTALLSSSAPAAGAGELYRIPPMQPRTKLGWVDSPEDLYQNVAAKLLWGLSEAEGARYVFAAKAP